MIPGLIEKPVPKAPADHIRTDPAPLQIRNSGGSTPSGPGQRKRFLFRLSLCLLCRRALVSRRLPYFSACQCLNRIHQTIAPNLDQVIQGVNTAAPAVPVPVPFPGHIDQAVMLLVPVIGAVPFEHAGLMGLQPGEQVRLPCRLNLLFGYTGHGVGTDFRFIVLRLLPVMI